MSVNDEIRAYFQNGIGTRKVKINRGQVFTTGAPAGHGDNRWRFVGEVNDILREIDGDRRKAA
jgi:hypothetical protein